MNLETLKELYVERTSESLQCREPTNQSTAEDGERCFVRRIEGSFRKASRQTKGHVQRLEEVFEELGEKTKGKTCQAMKGLIEEGSEVLKAEGEDSVIDAAIIVAAQKVEHYEIAVTAVYGPLRNYSGRTNPPSFCNKLWMRNRRQTSF